VTLGQVLKSKRLELGKSIEQIATATRIHIKVLKALEEDQYADLPARAFTRGFIIAYCKALQIDSEQILRDYHDFLESKFAERPEKDHGHQGYAFEGKEQERTRRWQFIIAGGAAFFMVLALLFFKPQNRKHKEKHKELIAEEAEIAANEATLAPSVTPVDPNAANASVTPTATLNASPSAAIVANNFVIAAPSPSSSIAAPTSTINATPTPIASPIPTATPVATATPTPIKEDPLNKGDGLLPKDTGVKIVLQATEDTMIHYHSDDRKPFSIMLRKDKQLVIKASSLIRVETDSPEHLKYKLNFKNKAPTAFSELKQGRVELRSDGTETNFDAGAL